MPVAYTMTTADEALEAAFEAGYSNFAQSTNIISSVPRIIPR